MKILSNILAILLAIQLSLSCSDDNDVNKDIESAITISADSLMFSSNGELIEGTSSVTVNSGEEWKLIEGEQSWCKASINGSTVTFTVDKNTTTDTRIASFSFYWVSDIRNSVKLTITQEQSNAIQPEHMTYTISPNGGRVVIKVDANIDFNTVIPSEYASWLSLEPKSESRGLSMSQVLINVDKSSEQMRTGEVVLESEDIDDVIITIHQRESNLDQLSSQESNEFIETALVTRRKESLAKFGSEWNNKELENSAYKMKFDYKVFGSKPEDGRALYISMHGGGGTTAEANDQQWNNQKNLYQPTEGIYFVPRSPTDSWNMWHQGYMDGFIEKIIELAVIKEGVNPNKVYIMGYSAGGDGTYQLAPRLADLWAGAAMSAGHPGDAKAENLRNLPFALYMGGNDAAYDRNTLAGEWGQKLDNLLASDSEGYIHDVQIYTGVGHWMELRDNVSMTWLPQFKRNAIPTKVVWIQDDIIRSNFYWIEATADGRKQGAKIIATYNSDLGEVHIEESTHPSVIICLNDKMMNLDNPVKVFFKGEEIFNDIVPRSKSNIDADVAKMRDSDLIFPAKLRINSDRTVSTIK